MPTSSQVAPPGDGPSVDRGTALRAVANRVTSTPPKLPGEPGLWIFIFGDMLVFGLMFCTYLFYRADAPALYARSQLLLNRPVGAINTLVLLTSSWFIAAAVQDAEKGSPGRTIARKLGAGWCCGLLFIILKAGEYAQKLHAGINVTTNDFFMFYFVLTGVHFVHVLVGLAVIGYFWRSVAGAGEAGHGAAGVGRLGGAGRGAATHHLESAGVFWHLIDLLWIVLFPLLYLVS